MLHDLWTELFKLTPSITVPLFKVFFIIRLMLRNGGVWGWAGVGDVKFLHIERKITSVVHSHPPSHYIRTRALGWRLMMFTLLAARKTKLNAFASMLPHCAAHMWRTISSFLSRPWTAVVFGMALSCFSVWRASPHPSLQQAACGMPPLTSQPCGVTCVLKFPFHTWATRGLWGTESQITQHRLYNVPLSRFGFLPGLGTNENLQWQWLPRRSSPRGAFSLENIRSQGAVGLITCKFTITSQRKTRIAWENTPKECGRIPARRIFFGNRQGMCM